MLFCWGNAGTVQVSHPAPTPRPSWGLFRGASALVLFMPMPLPGRGWAGQAQVSRPVPRGPVSSYLMVEEGFSAWPLPSAPCPAHQHPIPTLSGQGSGPLQHPTGFILKPKYLQGTLGQLCSQPALDSSGNDSASLATSLG